MKHYKNTNGEVFAYDSEQERQEWGAPELVEMTTDEVEAHFNPIPTAEQLLEQAVAEAHTYLNSTDYVVIKINEAQVLGQDITAMKAEYADVLAEREVKRQFIRENS